MSFEEFLRIHEGITSQKAIASRISKLNWVVEQVKLTPDAIVGDKNSMIKAREIIYSTAPNEKRAGNYYNALRKYYAYKNGKEFEKIYK